MMAAGIAVVAAVVLVLGGAREVMRADVRRRARGRAGGGVLERDEPASRDDQREQNGHTANKRTTAIAGVISHASNPSVGEGLGFDYGWYRRRPPVAMAITVSAVNAIPRSHHYSARKLPAERRRSNSNRLEV
jgi:hypothetical protein